MTGPNYGLFGFKPERINADVEIINLEKEDGYIINPDKLDSFIKSINDKLKNKKYKDFEVKNEEDLITLFYSQIKLRFLMGKSIVWPNKDELVGRFTFAKSEKEIVDALVLMNDIISNMVSVKSFGGES